MSISALHEFPELLKARLRGVAALGEAQINALQAHCELMLRWNARLNLTRVTELREVVERHYCESLFVGGHLPEGNWTIADIGSGAGFPGIPVAVLRPDCHVTLVESHQRKAVFLRECTRGMANVKVAAARAEAGKDVFDWVVSRAVSYEDLQGVLANRSRCAALLTGAVEASEMPGYCWDEKIPLPWGGERFLWLGRHE